MLEYTTITVSRETKRMLERLKGEKTWDEFLLEMAFEYRKVKAEKAREYVKKYVITDDEVDVILGGVEEDRKLWK